MGGERPVWGGVAGKWVGGAAGRGMGESVGGGSLIYVGLIADPFLTKIAVN